MNKLISFLEALPEQLKPVLTGIGIVGLLIAAIMMMLGKRMREEGKEHARNVLTGLAVGTMSASIVAWVVSLFA